MPSASSGATTGREAKRETTKEGLAREGSLAAFTLPENAASKAKE